MNETSWRTIALAAGCDAGAIVRRERMIDKLHAATQEVVAAADELQRAYELALEYDPRAAGAWRMIDPDRAFDAIRDWKRALTDVQRTLERESHRLIERDVDA